LFILEVCNSKALLIIFSIPLSIILLLNCCGADVGMGSAQPTENLDDNFISYENTDYGIKIQYPYRCV
jgi:hypothetical protein